MFFPKENPTVFIKIEVYVINAETNGYWDIDNNRVYLSPKLYSQFCDCKTQLLQSKFFSNLKQVSQTLITFTPINKPNNDPYFNRK